ncbi:RNA polymerase sigma-70 factor (ECF subfamily) [Variovorax beijingensis]|uniref:RNA polymerase sigma-70 factor (ECF subfamily) n=2 Tax=Variovorax TaxID=34072 RepID=A0AAE4BY14_VARPD|nr:RNA polymerase sigma-70 factor (ECF subfamily) [Variovorax paradoxus]MDR6427383.1 RNA polymerase sigma-70 factor (ECF subfamily) [Variovorax paradoxus]MDR6454545.1 RNA polymerase sigma-70 factor (ECF subfamily) [Variovorax paradoxus]TWD85624.1 RNA polymerase sigma-70 factor (ECF subfamily) [Variovorax beijingensis]
MPDSSPDAELMALIDLVGRRDENALRLLYERTSPKLFGLAMRVLRQREWAEDVLQESFLTIWRVAGDYRSTLSPPLAWMGLIVRSRSLDLLRRRSADRAHLTQEFDEQMAETFESSAANPMDTTDASEQAWALHQCLSRLEDGQREVLSLAYLRELSHSELAGQLKLPLGTVKTWIRRGLEKLRSCMQQFT